MSDKKTVVSIDDELDHERAAAREELARRKADERGRYYEPNGRAEQFIAMLQNAGKRKDGITIFILRAGNSFGKTALAVNLVNYLSDNVENKYFDKIPYLRNFKKPSRGRICTTANAANKTYPDEFRKWFSRGKFKGVKKGREFESFYEFSRTGSAFDIFTFDQDPDAGESITLDWAIVDEPMSQRHFSGLKSRLRFGGIIVFILTPLEGSGWYGDVFETPERLGKDVFVMEGSSEDSCITHGIRGFIPHAALADMWADFDEDELAARRDGKYLHLGGVIYKSYRDEEGGHVLTTLPPYYQERWDVGDFTLYCVTDPADRKPFAFSWHAVFPNNVAITVAEWPDESWRPFHKIKSCAWDVPTYTKMILETEKAIGKPAGIRLIDPNFGPAAKAGGQSVIQQFFDCGMRDWQLPPDSIKDGHSMVKNLLGNIQQNVAPHYFVMAHCKNMRYGLSHYGYKENRDESKGLSETPELVNKDFPDTLRYPALFGLRYIKKEISVSHVIHVPRKTGNYVGA